MGRLALVLVLLAQLTDPATLIRQAQTALETALQLLTPTIAVPAGADLQAVYDTAPAGSTLILAAGATFGPLTINQAKALTLTSSGILPAAGVRVTPATAAAFAKLQAPGGTTPALRLVTGGGNVSFVGLEIKPTPGGRGDLITCDGGSGYVFDRLYVHGDPLVGQKRGLALNCGATTVKQSYIADIKGVGQDTQAIAMWNGPGPYTLLDNYLEAAGENVLVGGADPTTPNLVPSDIVIRGNTLAKPLAWRSQAWSVKNILELKNARRVTVDGNTLTGSWTNGQTGFGIMLTVRNQDGACPWCTIEDVLITGNTVTAVGAGINILGEDTDHPSGHMARVTITDNTFAIVPAMGAGRTLQIERGPTALVLRRNVITSAPGLNSIVTFVDPPSFPLAGFVVDGNTFSEGDYGLFTSSTALGKAAIDRFAPGYVWTNNVVVRGSSGRTIQYPPGTTLK